MHSEPASGSARQAGPASRRNVFSAQVGGRVSGVHGGYMPQMPPMHVYIRSSTYNFLYPGAHPLSMLSLLLFNKSKMSCVFCARFSNSKS